MSASSYVLFQDVVVISNLEDITPKGFARQVGVYSLESVTDSDLASAPFTHYRHHVNVNTLNRRWIRAE